MSGIYIAIGANIDSPFGSPQQSLEHLETVLKGHGVHVLKSSRLFRNPAWPNPNDPEFLNGCLEVETTLSPQDLLETLLKIEQQFGRERAQKNAPRSLDLDIIDYKSEVIDNDHLQLPHSRLHERGFVLLPLFDIAPNWQHLEGAKISELIEKLSPETIDQTIPMIHKNHAFKSAPILMGIVNTTPDSFHDGGQHNDIDKAVEHARRLIDEGAQIIDIGGESTRPGAKPVSIEEEIKRTAPVIAILAAETEHKGIQISIDTRNAKTMEAAIDAGADMINDVSALTHDPRALEVVTQFGGHVCLMHMQGSPETMQDEPQYNDAVTEVMEYLKHRIDTCLKVGISIDKITVDPGIGFGKTLDQNLQILNNLDHFHDLGVPVLLGTSRKSFIEKICANTPSEQRLPGSLTSNLIGLDKDIQIFRVHDVAETKQAFDVHYAIKKA